VIEVDLADELPTLQVLPGYSGVRVIYRLRNRAIGHSDFTASQLPLSPAQLAMAAAHDTAAAVGDCLLDEGLRAALPGLPEPEPSDPCRALHHLLAQNQPLTSFEDIANRGTPSQLATISVAVCTRNRPAELERCLQSLAKLKEQPQEIIVVDNAPEDYHTRRVMESFPGVRYLAEPRRGLSAARNTALLSACSEIVAFTDDDVVVDPEWTARLRRIFHDSRTMAVTGLILPAELETRAQLIFERNLAWFHQGYRVRKFDLSWFEALKSKGVQAWSIGAGANMAIRRGAWDLGFRFDTRLGPGVFGGCGEDSEYWYRLVSAGWQCVYDPSAIVYHYHRRDLSALRKQIRQYMQGHVASLILQYRKDSTFGNLRELLLALPLHYVVLLLRAIAGGFALEECIEFNGLLGAFRGLGFLFGRGEEAL
jgi:GT2 family glycosyltransferase